MRKLNILKALIDLFFFFAAFATLAMVVFVPIVMIDGEGIPIKLNGTEIEVVDWQTKVLLVLSLVGALCFIYSIFLLRKVIGYFMKRDLFHEKVISHLNRIGQFLIASTILVNVPLFFYNMFHRQHVGVQFTNGGLDSLLMSVSLGLFFMVLSEVFKIAKHMKEENELTV